MRCRGFLKETTFMTDLWWLICAIRVFAPRPRQEKSQKLTNLNGEGAGEV
jgi:hypothetical protein